MKTKTIQYRIEKELDTFELKDKTWYSVQVPEDVSDLEELEMLIMVDARSKGLVETLHSNQIYDMSL